MVNQQQGHGWPRLIDLHGEQRLARVVRSNRRAAVAHIAKKVYANSDGKVSECTVCRCLLCMRLHSHRAFRVPMLTSVQHWIMKQWKKLAWFDEPCFLSHHLNSWVSVTSSQSSVQSMEAPPRSLKDLLLTSS